MQEKKILPLILACFVIFGAYFVINGEFSPANEPVKEIKEPVKEVKLLKIKDAKCDNCNNTNNNCYNECEGSYQRANRPVLKAAGNVVRRISWRIFHPFGGRFRCR